MQREDELWSDIDGEIGACRATCGVFVGWLDVGWDGPHTPRSCLRDVEHLPIARERDLKLAARRVRAARARALTRCRFCREQNVPGHMHEDVCHGCAERHLGVVH